MTVESLKTKEVYKGNGAATVFPAPFAYGKTDDIRLILTDAAGVDSPVTGNYQISVNENGDTSVIYPVDGPPLAAGTRLTVYRHTPQTQIVDLIHGGAWNPEVVEHDGLDRAVMMIQELREGLDRAVKVPMSGDSTPEGLAADLFNARDRAAEEAARAIEAAGAAALAADRAEDQADRAEETVVNAITGIESVAQEARLSVALEGANQVNRVQAEGEAKTALAALHAQKAKEEADRAEAAADMVQEVTNLEPASRTRLGLVRIGDGVMVAPDGTISVQFSVVVSTPAISFPAEVGLGYAYEATFSASTGAPDARIEYFEVTLEDQAPIIVQAVDGSAAALLTPSPGPGGSVGKLAVLAVDSLGNMSQAATATFIKNTVFIEAPAVTGPVSGSTGVSITPSVTVQHAVIQGVEGQADATHIQIATDAAFADIAAQHPPESGYSIMYAPPALLPSRTYHIRARHRFETYGWSGWGATTTFTTVDAAVTAPAIFNPVDGETNTPLRPAVNISAFANIGPTDTPKATQMQIASDAAFTDIVAAHSGAYTISFMPEANLPLHTTHYVRARHQGNLWGWSAWSDVTAFTTVNASLAVPAVTSPAHEAIDFPLAGPVMLGAPQAVGQITSSMQVHISTTSDFAALAYDSGETAFSQSVSVSGLTKSTAYYLRARLRGSVTGWTGWSPAVKFTTTSVSPGDNWLITQSGDWTVPGTGTYRITLVGGGGGGGSGGCSFEWTNGDKDRYNEGGSGGGGGGGGSQQVTLSLTKGATLAAVVGAGGTGGNAGGTGKIYASGTYSAKGGKGGVGGGATYVVYGGVTNGAGGGFGGGGGGGAWRSGQDSGTNGAGGGGGSGGGANPVTGNTGTDGNAGTSYGASGGTGGGAAGTNATAGGSGTAGSLGQTASGAGGVSNLRPSGTSYGSGGAGGKSVDSAYGQNGVNGTAGCIHIQFV